MGLIWLRSYRFPQYQHGTVSFVLSSDFTSISTGNECCNPDPSCTSSALPVLGAGLVFMFVEFKTGDSCILASELDGLSPTNQWMEGSSITCSGVWLAETFRGVSGTRKHRLGGAVFGEGSSSILNYEA